MIFILGFGIGVAVGLAASWAYNNPEQRKAKWAELVALFKKKDAP